METGDIVVLVVLLVLIVLSGLFSGAETAYSAAQKARLQAMEDDGEKRAGKVINFLDKYERILSTILIGNNIVNITCATLGTILFSSLIENGDIANTVSTIVITVVVLIFGEITPKTLAKERPEKAAILFYPFIVVCYYILLPFNFIFSGWKWLLGKIFKFKKEVSFTEEELINIVENAEEEGELESHESELIRSAIEFEDREVIDIMIPRVNVISVDIEDSMEDIYNTYVESGYSRLPVYKDTIDNVLGIIHEKDFYKLMHDGVKDISAIIQQTICVPATMKISSALREIQRSKVHLAIVVDEFGGTKGIVALEDILEELVGEIYDEHDAVQELCKKISDTEYVVAGEQNLEEFLDELNITLDEDDEEERIDATTVGGFVSEQMDKIPQKGEKFTFKNLEVEITNATTTRVNEVKVVVCPQDTDEE